MTEKCLIDMGFKKETDGEEYWYVLKVKGGHEFITNDTLWNGRKDKWIIGYEGKENKDRIFWFNNNLIGGCEFKIIFHVLIGKDFKLAHQRKLIR